MGIHHSPRQARDASSPMRLGRAARVGLAPPIALLLVLAGCSGGGGSDDDAQPEVASARTPDSEVTVQLGGVNVESAGPPVEIDPQDAEVLRARVARYVELATVAPLSGRETTGLEELFTSDTGLTLLGSDRASLVDEGLGTAATPISTSMATVGLQGLADQQGALVLVVATLALDVETTTEEGPLRISRLGDLVFVPDGGAWKINGYDLTVERSAPGATGADRSSEVSS